MKHLAPIFNELTGDALQDVRGHNLDFSIDAGEVRSIIGVDAGSFQQWLARGLLSFETVKAGKRTFRKFHIGEVPRLVLISEIWKNGVLVGEAIQVADSILSKVSGGPFSGAVSKHLSRKALLGAEELVPLKLVLWFRQANLVWLHRQGDEGLSGLFAKEGYASCIIIHVDTLKKRIREAVSLAKRTCEAKGHPTVDKSGGVKKV